MKIAISGKMCSGKSTVTEHIIQKYKNEGIELKKLSFADPIKNVAYEWFNMSKDPEKKDRHLLQTIGRKMREIDVNVWVNAFINHSSKFENVICDDVRFPNEVEALKNAGFIILRLDIDKETQILRLKKTYKNFEKHLQKLDDISEIALDEYRKFDYIIDNNSISLNKLLHDINRNILHKYF